MARILYELTNSSNLDRFREDATAWIESRGRFDEEIRRSLVELGEQFKVSSLDITSTVEALHRRYVVELDINSISEHSPTRVIMEEKVAKDLFTRRVFTRDASIFAESLTLDATGRALRQLNEERFAGFSEWRLCTKNELISLLAYACSSQGVPADIGATASVKPKLERMGFRNLKPNWYWLGDDFPPPYACVASIDTSCCAGAWDDDKLKVGYVSGGDTFFCWPICDLG